MLAIVSLEHFNSMSENTPDEFAKNPEENHSAQTSPNNEIIPEAESASRNHYNRA